MKMQKHWYLGFLGLIGLYFFPKVWAVFTGDGSWFDLSNLLWFLWFFYFVPDTKTDTENSDIS